MKMSNVSAGRDHIISVKNDHRPAYRRYEALQ
jgi:hypothetical protein